MKIHQKQDAKVQEQGKNCKKKKTVQNQDGTTRKIHKIK